MVRSELAILEDVLPKIWSNTWKRSAGSSIIDTGSDRSVPVRMDELVAYTISEVRSETAIDVDQSMTPVHDRLLKH